VIVTKHGLPIDYEEFPGNCYEGHTLLPVIDKIKARYHIDQVVLVADAALMNKINLSTLTEKKINYVIATRIKNTKKEIQGKILDQSDYEKVSGDKDDLIQAKQLTFQQAAHWSPFIVVNAPEKMNMTDKKILSV
jgi:transposase